MAMPLVQRSPRTEADQRTALDLLFRDSLSPSAAGLSALYAIFAISHALILPKAIALPMSLVAGGTAIMLLMIRLRLRRSPLAAKWAHPLGATIAGLVLVNSLLHIALTDQPMQTTNVLLLLIGAGFLFLSTMWLGLVLFAAFIGWGAIVWFATPSPEWLHFGFAMLTTSVLALLIHTARVRALTRLESLHSQEQVRQQELESALASMEEAHRAAEASKRDLMQSEASLRLLTSQMPAVLWTVDTELRFTSSMGLGLNALQLTANQIIGVTLFEYFQADSMEFLPIAAHQRALQGVSVAFEFEWNGHLFDSKVEPLRDADGKLIGAIGIALDITDRKHTEEQIKVSLQEKERLLKEIHNRVKNNLQVISSLLNLQAGYIEDEPARLKFKESQDRLKALALIHEKLYQSADLTSIDFAGYIRNLAVHLFRSHKVDAHAVALQINTDPINIDIDRAIPCGLILNELLTNALKYAFPNGKTGAIRIHCHEDAHRQLVLTVGDNGIGLPRDLDFRQTDSLGFQLINTLIDQIHGTIALDRMGGTTFNISFRH
jgi:PAS domain S-box-containing protein